MFNKFRNHIGLPIMLFVFLTITQLFFTDEIQWLSNIGLSIFVYIGYVLWDWFYTPSKREED